MGDEGQSGFWERVAPGHTTVCIGQGGRIPVVPRGAWVVRVRCDLPHRPLGPVLDAAERVASLVGGSSQSITTAGLLRRGLRRRLLGEEGGADREASLLVDLDRLAEAGEGATALVFEAVDAADPATLEFLLRIVRQPLRPALVLGFRSEPARGTASALLDAVVAVEGEGRVIRAMAPGPERAAKAIDLRGLPAPVLRVLRASILVGEAFEAELVGRLLGLDTLDVIERVQEAADAGLNIDDLGDGRFRLDSATAELLRAGLLPSLASAWHRALAGLLSEDTETEIPAVQADLHLKQVAPSEAVAQARPDDDDAPPPLFAETAPAEPAFSPPEAPREDLAAAFAASSAEPAPLPDPFAALSPPAEAEVAESEHKPTRIASPALPEDADPFASLGPSAPEMPAQEPSAPKPAAPKPAAPKPAAPKPAAPKPAAPEPDPFAALASPAADPEPKEPVVPPFVRPQARPEQTVWLAPGQEERAPAPVQARRAPRAAPQTGRAAHHLAAAGEAEAAIPRFLEAARSALAQGAAASAESYLNKALALARLLPDTPARRGLRAQAHLELARLHAEGSGGVQGFSLADALQEAEEALRLTEGSATPALQAEIQTVIAAILYDIGDEASLNRALACLVQASHALMSVQDARGAARLLNDQAAVWVRLGDPVRAAHLLGESRKVFSSLSEKKPEDAAELAETDHLLARLPLHVGARPGMEAAAIEAALGHAAAAAEVYHALGQRRELGRIWETVGRLELRRKGLARARESFARAFSAARDEGDLLGMARAAGGLAEEIIAEGQPSEALPVLAESIRLNLAKGSRLGLAANRAVLEGLVAGLPEASRGAPALAQLAAVLKAAEARLGVGG